MLSNFVRRGFADVPSDTTAPRNGCHGTGAQVLVELMVLAGPTTAWWGSSTDKRPQVLEVAARLPTTQQIPLVRSPTQSLIVHSCYGTPLRICLLNPKNFLDRKSDSINVLIT